MNYERLVRPGYEIEFEYISELGEHTHRVVAVEGVNTEAGDFWGWCHLRQERRNFKHERIVPDTARLWDGQRVVDAYTGEVLVAAKDDILVVLRNRAEGWTL